MFLQGSELFRLGSPELINLILTLQGVVYKWQKMLLFRVLSMGNRLIKCFPIRTISSSREKSQRWACIQFLRRHFLHQRRLLLRHPLQVEDSPRHWKCKRQRRGRREEDQNKSAEAYFVEVNLHLEHTVLAFVRYFWQRKADLEKKQPARLQAPLVLRCYQGTKCSPSSVGRGANSALSLLLGICFQFMCFLSLFETPGRRVVIRRAFISRGAEGQIDTASDETAWWYTWLSNSEEEIHSLCFFNNSSYFHSYLMLVVPLSGDAIPS